MWSYQSDQSVLDGLVSALSTPPDTVTDIEVEELWWKVDSLWGGGAGDIMPPVYLSPHLNISQPIAIYSVHSGNTLQAHYLNSMHSN